MNPKWIYCQVLQPSCLKDNSEIYMQISDLWRNRRRITLRSCTGRIFREMLAWGPTPQLHLRGLLPVKASQQLGPGWPLKRMSRQRPVMELKRAQRLLMTLTPPACFNWQLCVFCKWSCCGGGNNSSLLSLTVAYIFFAIALIILRDTLSWRACLLITHSCMFISSSSPAVFLPPPGSLAPLLSSSDAEALFYFFAHFSLCWGWQRNV